MIFQRANVRSRKQRRRLLVQGLETRSLLAADAMEYMDSFQNNDPSAHVASAYHNASQPTDVNRDGSTYVFDALLVINQLRRSGPGYAFEGSNESGIYPDVNNDGIVTALDALRVINYLVLNAHNTPSDSNDTPRDEDAEHSDEIGDDAGIADENDHEETDEFDEPFIVEAELVGDHESQELIGYESDDTLTGGGGPDVFWITAGNDVITDFDAGQGDVLNVQDFASGEDGYATLTSLEAIASLSEQVMVDGEPALVIDIDGEQGNWETTLVGITIDDLSEDSVFFGPGEADLMVDVTHVPTTTILLNDGTVAEFEGHDMEVHPLLFELVSGEQASVDLINEILGITEADQDEDESDDDDSEEDSHQDVDDDNDSDEEIDQDIDDDDDSDEEIDQDIDDDNDSDEEIDQDVNDGDDSDQNDGTDGDSVDNGEDLNLQIDVSHTGTTEGFEVRTNGIFALWWDPQAGPIEPGADAVFELLNEARNNVQANLGLGDPPNTDAGYYFNVFVHRGDEDRFPSFFGNGVSFEADTELPDLALPEGLHDDRSNVLHEAFHVFQTSSNYETVDTNPDALWIIEASAEWYQAHRNSSDPRSFLVSGSPYALPHLSWWYTPGREPQGVTEDNGWLYGIREYAMSSWLYYLTDIESVDPAVIAGVYATDSELTAQEYIFNEVGGDNLREMFADWAARNAAGLDHLTNEQAQIALNELAAETTPSEIKNNILELTDTEANGTFEPTQELTPGGWAYNSIKINNTQDTTYTIDVIGDATGSEGAASHFEARVAVVNGQTTTYHDVQMADTLSGQFVLNATAADSEIYVVIASTPDQLTGTQTYDYQVNISTEVTDGVSDSDELPTDDDANTDPAGNSLKIYVLAGQSNAGGYGYTYDAHGGIEENVTSIEFLLDDSPESTQYRNNLEAAGTHTVLPHLDASWTAPRDDVWAVTFDSSTGESQPVENTLDPNEGDYPIGVQPLGPGFGDDIFHAASFGPELGLGQQLGRNQDSPVLIVKSSHGGSSLAVDWRSPRAVAQRGGTVGTSYQNTIESISQTLDTLQADLEDDGVLNAYNNATSYEIAGFIWLQGWNDHLEESHANEYKDNLTDLIQSIRNSDPRIATDLPAVIIESSDQDEVLNAARIQAVEELNQLNADSAVFVETDDLIGQDWGDNREGEPWNETLDFHFDGKAENFLELGWVAGQAILDNGFTGQPAK